MTFKDNHRKIKKTILKGGLVVAGRCSGKTRALAEILLENTNAVVVYSELFQRQRLQDYLIEHLTKNEINSRLFHSSNAGIRLKGLHKDVYIDEYFFVDYKGPFHAAVTSFPFKVTVIK